MAEVAQKTNSEAAVSRPDAAAKNGPTSAQAGTGQLTTIPQTASADGRDTAVLLAEGSQSSTPPPPKSEQVAVIVQPGFFTRNLWLLQRAFWAAQEDNCFAIAKGAAYSGLLCLFPVLATTVAILVQVRAEAMTRLFRYILLQVVPPDTDELIRYQFQNHPTRPLPLLIGAAFFALWAASGAMLSLMEGFQAAYRIPSGRSMIHQRLIAVLLVLAVAVPSAAASILLVGTRQETTLWQWLGFASPDADVRESLIVAARILRYFTAALTTVFVTGLLYYFGPHYRMQPRMTKNAAAWRFLRVWPGAIFATAMWFLATIGFSWYVHNIAKYNVVYGALSAGVILIVWLYLLALIAMVGCEFNAERERSQFLLSL